MRRAGHSAWPLRCNTWRGVAGLLCAVGALRASGNAGDARQGGAQSEKERRRRDTFGLVRRAELDRGFWGGGGNLGGRASSAGFGEAFEVCSMRTL
eukprot:6172316-Pleurochrysis_carterae.AAC.6